MSGLLETVGVFALVVCGAAPVFAIGFMVGVRTLVWYMEESETGNERLAKIARRYADTVDPEQCVQMDGRK